MKTLCLNNEKEIEFIDDLSFGDYIFILSNPLNWDKLNLKIEICNFIKHLDKIRIIRNDVMHFDPEGIPKEQTKDVLKIANFLNKLKKYN